jgi:hypothetical protein
MRAAAEDKFQARADDEANTAFLWEQAFHISQQRSSKL